MSPERRKKFDEEYRDLVLSELLIALMKEDDVSVRELACQAGLSSAIVQVYDRVQKKILLCKAF